MDSYNDELVRRSIRVQRVAASLLGEFNYPALGRAYRAVRLILLNAENIDSIKTRNAVIAEIKKSVGPIITSGLEQTTGSLNAIAVAEASFSAKMIGEVNGVSLTVPAKDKIESYVKKATLHLASDTKTNVGTWPTFIRKNSESVSKRMIAQVRTGYRNKESVGQMIKRLKRVSNGALRNEVEALVRTGASHYASNAQRAMANDNLDIIEREIPNVTFDNRVTRICISIASKYQLGWPVNKSPIGYPPYHFNCRTLIQYLVEGQKFVDGTKSYVGGKKGEAAETNFNERNERLNKRRDNPNMKGVTSSQVKRRGNNDAAFTEGQIKTSTPLSKFLADQPEWFVAETLKSKKLARAFKEGKLDLSKLTDKNLKPLKLDALL